MFTGKLCGWKKGKLKTRMAQVLDQVGMKHAAKFELKAYSKGMLQRMGIAQAILHDPELLVLDEPMSGLDPLGRKDMRELIKSLAKEGKTIFFSSHVIPDVETICDQVAVIQDGTIQSSGWIGKFLEHGPLTVEIAFQGVTLEKARHLSPLLQNAEPIPEGLHVHVSGQEQMTRTLKTLLERNIQVLWAAPVRPSLEDLFKEKAKA